MKTMTEKLADALREIRDRHASDYSYDTNAMRSDDWECADKALAEYDAEQALRLPTEYRVTWEIDAFNAETPRGAAEEARDAMTRAGTTATLFTVLAADGTVTEVDLSEEG